MDIIGWFWNMAVKSLIFDRFLWSFFLNWIVFNTESIYPIGFSINWLNYKPTRLSVMLLVLWLVLLRLKEVFICFRPVFFKDSSCLSYVWFLSSYVACVCMCWLCGCGLKELKVFLWFSYKVFNSHYSFLWRLKSNHIYCDILYVIFKLQ